MALSAVCKRGCMSIANPKRIIKYKNDYTDSTPLEFAWIRGWEGSAYGVTISSVTRNGSRIHRRGTLFRSLGKPI